MAHAREIVNTRCLKNVYRPTTGHYCNHEQYYTGADTACYPSTFDNVVSWRDASVHNTRDKYGWRKPSAYLYYRHRWQRSAGTNERYRPASCSSWYLDYPTGRYYPSQEFRASTAQFPPGSIIELAARQELRNKLLAKANRTEFDLGVALGEGRETYRMVRDTVLGIKDFFSDMKKGRLGQAAKRLLKQNPADAWLQYRYGWLPAVNDIQNAVNLWEKYMDGEYTKLRFHVKSQVVRPWSSGDTISPNTSGPSLQRATHGAFKVKGRYDYQVNDDFYVGKAACGVHNLGSILWNLATLSFVVDWLVSVGDYLEAWTRQGALTYLGGTQTFVFEGAELSRWVDGNGYVIHNAAPKPMEHEMFKFQRWVESDPKPGLTVDPDVLLGLWSDTRIYDAVALLYSTVRGGTESRKRFRYLR